MLEAGFELSFKLLISSEEDELLKDAVSAFTEQCDKETTNIETEITNKIKNAQKEMVNELITQQQVRNRSIIKEIVETIAKYKKDI